MDFHFNFKFLLPRKPKKKPNWNDIEIFEQITSNWIIIIIDSIRSIDWSDLIQPTPKINTQEKSSKSPFLLHNIAAAAAVDVWHNKNGSK